ncbi:MAG: hypothetical protein LBK06_06580, partial [Planctomycetaceae bacterium]|nr:hypothetical protein [Planctomycetaceae bacterium]
METAEVNNSQAATFKSSLAGAAFISSRGEVYRLFQGVDDPTLGNDFLLNECDLYEFDRNKIHDQNEINSIDNESNFESDFNSKIEPVANTDLQTENIAKSESCHLQIDDLSEQFSRQLFEEPKFRVVKGDCESAVAELLALEVPKPIINVPENIPPQDVTLDEKIRRSRGVTGICRNFQATTQDKIIGNINVAPNNVAPNNIANSNFSVTKNTSTKKTPVATNPISDRSSRAKSKIILPFRPSRDNTAFKIDEILRDNLIPILDSIPDFFNTEPKTIRFVPNSTVTQIEVDEIKNSPITDAENDNKIADEVVDQNIVTINDAKNIDSNIDSNIDNIDENILPFPVDGRVGDVSDIDIDVDVNLSSSCLKIHEADHVSETSRNICFETKPIVHVGGMSERELFDYKLPERIELLIGKAGEWVLDLGDRFIDFLRAGKRVISVN